ncbi:hypothetical protein AeRB84_016330 [Aphanomyces euteiches]|nr:hypothetical protein AeRB84_016330 [Aphanomyces euteiches]
MLEAVSSRMAQGADSLPRQTNGQQAIIAIYVDDLVLVAQNDHVMADLKSAIKQRFASKDMGPIHYIFGLKIIRDRKKRLIHISQPLNALNMLKRFQLDRARPATIPLNEVLKASDSPTEDQSKSEAYAAMHASTRPDLAYAVQSLSRFLNRPGKNISAK